MGPPPESFLPPEEDEGEDEDESEEEMLSDASPWTYSSSSDKQVEAEGGHSRAGGCRQLTRDEEFCRLGGKGRGNWRLRIGWKGVKLGFKGERRLNADRRRGLGGVVLSLRSSRFQGWGGAVAG